MKYAMNYWNEDEFSDNSKCDEEVTYMQMR
jgi:hypothetical protein